ncbi:hypothetical protein L1Z01_19025, partial [Acinetobacter baumannii]|nr:hypothetical protein [Acinetobacter baumannii]MCF4490448.1 hypothetical protein [Acinetobacter baumannii]MCF4531591.1 hypothetical protein [Acinetobacter baumannii]MCF4539666.1 hypothetical protein [Acinetobacter baumannii]MCF4623364.1 hypothetical protein [Acinetobacter baumannii]
RSLRAGLVGFARTPSEKEDPSSLKSSFMQSLNLILILDSNPLFFTLVFRPLRATSLTQHDRMLFIFKIESRGN